MSGNPTDQDLLAVVGAASPNDVDDVTAILRAIGGVLPGAYGSPWPASTPTSTATSDAGLAGRMLAVRNVRQAGDPAWEFADHWRGLTGIGRRAALLAGDKLTGALGRSLLLPLH
jgi:hypothetical protein